MNEPTFLQVVYYLASYAKCYGGKYHPIVFNDIFEVIKDMDDHAYDMKRIITEFKAMFTDKFPFKEVCVGLLEDTAQRRLKEEQNKVQAFETEFKDFLASIK